MKKAFFIALFSAVLFMSATMPTECSFGTPNSTQIASNVAEKNSQTATTSIPIPEVQYFHERATIARWTKHWDKPTAIPCYVYLISYGKVLGYHVTYGKPASTRSYITPEYKFVRSDQGEYDGDTLVEAQAIDGTYGEDNPGIRFFTASGIAIEWSGAGCSQQISDAPLNWGYDVPLLTPLPVAVKTP